MAASRIIVGIILGTGHGGGIAIRGQSHAGLQGLAGEIGHYSLHWPREGEYPGPKCWCGRHGCLEMFCSGTGFELDWKTTTGEAKRASEIMALKRAGDTVAMAVYGRYVDRLARSLALIIDLVDPDVFVLGGGMSNVAALYDAVPRLWAPQVFSDSVRTVLAPARHGDSSGVRGAAWLAARPEVSNG